MLKILDCLSVIASPGRCQNIIPIDFIQQIVQLKCSFDDEISKLNSVYDFVKFIIVDGLITRQIFLMCVQLAFFFYLYLLQ